MLGYFQSKIIAIFFLGFVCGIPVALTLSTLVAWLSVAGISNTTIGIFSMVTLPYALKFIWSPIVDNIRIPYLYKKLGHRRSWLLIVQLFLSFAIIKLGFSNPQVDIYAFAFWATIVTIFSSTQDMIIDAYRVEILNENQQGIGSSSFIFGGRIGLLVSSGGSLLLIDFLCKSWHICDNFAQWTIAYIISAILIFIGIIATLIIGESLPDHQKIIIGHQDSLLKYLSNIFSKCFISPLLEIMQKHNWYLILIFIVIYRLCDSFISSMLNPFFLDIGFSLTEIALAVKSFGFFTTLFGSLLGGILIHKLGITRGLFIAGIAQMLSNSMFVIQAQVGYHQLLLYLSIAVESIGGGMATAVFISYISSLCLNSKYTATQYALLSSLAAINVVFSPIFAGWVSDSFGWTTLFTISIVLGIPPLILLCYLTKERKKRSTS